MPIFSVGILGQPLFWAQILGVACCQVHLHSHQPPFLEHPVLKTVRVHGQQTGVCQEIGLLPGETRAAGPLAGGLAQGAACSRRPLQATLMGRDTGTLLQLRALLIHNCTPGESGPRQVIPRVRAAGSVWHGHQPMARLIQSQRGSAQRRHSPTSVHRPGEPVAGRGGRGVCAQPGWGGGTGGGRSELRRRTEKGRSRGHRVHWVWPLHLTARFLRFGSCFPTGKL